MNTPSAWGSSLLVKMPKLTPLSNVISCHFWKWGYLYSSKPPGYYFMDPCMDPESFVRGGQFQLWCCFLCFLVDEGREGPNTTERHFACWLMMAQHWIRLGSFVFFQGIRTSIAKERYGFVIFQGGGGFKTPCHPLWICACVHRQFWDIGES